MSELISSSVEGKLTRDYQPTISIEGLSRQSITHDKWQKDIQTVIAKTTLTIGAAVSQGDCFFDALAQTLEDKNIEVPGGKDKPAYKRLRLLCDNYLKQINKQPSTKNWVKAAIDADAGIGGQDFETCLATIQYTQSEMEELKKENIFSGQSTWGRPSIEGRILCAVLFQQLRKKFRLHIVDFQPVDIEGEITPIIGHKLVDGDGGKDISGDGIDYNDNTLIHLFNYKAHYVPLLKRAPKLTPFNERSLLRSTTAQMVNALAGSAEEEVKASKLLRELTMYGVAPGTAIHGDITVHQTGMLHAAMEHVYVPDTQVHHISVETVNYGLTPINPDDVLCRWQLPPDNASFFVGREALLNQLREQFINSASQRLVLSAVAGLGGVGKSQLALYYVHHAQELLRASAVAAASATDTSAAPTSPYRWRLWFHAESESTLLSDYQHLAHALRLVEPDGKLESHEIVRRVKYFLEKHSGWLAIYDNAESYHSLKEFIPQQGGHVLITTRRTEWLRVRQQQAIEVSVFTEDEALTYLQTLTQHHFRTDADIIALKELVQRLGYLPLALAQAGAYIEQNQITPHVYLALYEQAEAALHSDKTLPPESKESLISDERQTLKTVSTGWVKSLKAIRLEEEKAHEVPLAERVLQAMSYLHSKGIPRELLERWLINTSRAATPTGAQLLLNKALQRLYAYSMIKLENSNISVHSLVQAVTRELDVLPARVKLLGEQKDETEELPAISPALIAITQSVLNSFYENETPSVDKTRQQLLLPHVNTLLQHYKRLKRDILPLAPEEVGHLLIAKGLVASQQATISEAIEANKQALPILEARLGKQHPQVAACIMNLGVLSFRFGDTQRAKVLLEQALPVLEAALGRQHLEVAKCLTNLGLVCLESGETHRAKILLEQALPLLKAGRGEQHPEVAGCLMNLGVISLQLGETRQAKVLLEQALPLLKAGRGEQHPEVAGCLHNLGLASLRLREIRQAKVLLEQALPLLKAGLGEQHPEVAGCLMNLGIASIALDEVDLAVQFLKRSADIFTTTLGQEHPQTQVVMTNLEKVSSRTRLKSLCQNELVELAKFSTKQLHLSGVFVHLKTTLEQLKNSDESAKQAMLHYDLGCYYHAMANAAPEQRRVLTIENCLARARMHFNQSMTLESHINHHVEYARFLMQQGEREEALAELVIVLECSAAEEKSSEHMNLSSTDYVVYKEFERVMFDETLRHELDDWKELKIPAKTLAYYLLIQIYQQKDNAEAARETLSEFHQWAHELKDTITYSLLGHSQQRLNQFASAMESYQVALRLKPEYPFAETCLTQCAKRFETAPIDTESRLTPSNSQPALHSQKVSADVASASAQGQPECVSGNETKFAMR